MLVVIRHSYFFSLLLFSILISSYLITASPLLAQTNSSNSELLENAVRAGAFVEAFTQFCERANKLAIANDNAQLKAWAQRNHWAAVQSRLNSDTALNNLFVNQKATFNTEFNSHRFKTALACGVLPQELHSTEHDPSVRYARELQALESTPPVNQTAAGPTASTAPSAPPNVNTAGSNNTVPVTAATPVVTQSTVSGQLSVGAATFTPPLGWSVAKNTPEGTILQTNTQHTKALILITETALNGDLHSTFANAVRSQFPGTGLQLQYTHEGTTGGGSPIITVLDTGQLRGTRQKEDIAAIGVGLGDKMQLALLMNGDWGGESVAYRRVFEKMIAGWRLSGERGPVWDPLRPPTPVGARAAFYMGARMENELNPLGGMNLMAVREYLVLLPTGQAFHGMPIGGHVLDMNFAAECERLPTACGTYRIQGGRIDFTWRTDYGMVVRQSSPFIEGGAGQSNVASFNGTRAFEVAPVHNLRISGRYTSTFYASGTAGINTSVTAQTFISFRPDGSYQKSGFSAASFSGNGAAGSVQNQRGIESGRYTLEGYTLTLTPSNGPPETYTTVFETVDVSPKAIFINDKSFLRDGV